MQQRNVPHNELWNNVLISMKAYLDAHVNPLVELLYEKGASQKDVARALKKDESHVSRKYKKAK